MTSSFIVARYDPVLVALSLVLAIHACYVALELTQRVRMPELLSARLWCLGGSVVMGTGIWATHFVGMLAMRVPFEVGYGYVATALSWLAALGVSAIALHVASCKQLTAARLAGGALAMGAGICAMHYGGMAAMDMAPAIRWSATWVLLSVAVAVAASALSLLIFFGLRRLDGWPARWCQLGAAVVMGGGISGMHYSGMAAAQFASGAVCRSAGQLQGSDLVLLASVAALMLLLGLSLLSSLSDARMRHQATQLSESLQEAHTELRQSAFRDALTGLPNRLLLDDRLNMAVQRCARHGGTLAVLFVNLDGFQPLNDSFGHPFGDAVLRTVAQRLKAQVRTGDTVARVGSDEFVLLLLKDRCDTTAAAQVAQRLIDALNQPLSHPGYEVRVSCSVGIALYPQDAAHDQLLIHANAAMAAVKRNGGAAYAFFAPHMHTGVREQMELQADLRQALARGELELHYQPKVSASSGAITGVEALARWRHPTRGMVGPAQFIAIAERFGLINALGDWVIAQACRQISAWQQQGLHLRVALNLSAHQLRQDGLALRVAEALRQHQIDPCMLMLEVTESVAMEDTDSTLQTFRQLKDMGLRFSIDDFGTGYSSLAYLRRLQVSQLKIDRSFVQDLESSADARAIVSAVVRLAHALGLSVVAEGVETTAQRDVLATLQCDELQGYLYAKPMPAAALAQWAQALQQAQQPQHA